MNSLLKKAGVPQLRCVPLAGGTTGFLSYEVMIDGQWIPSNYQFACWWVGQVQARSKRVTACLKQPKRLTGTIRIGGELWSTSWVSTESATESSSCDQGMRMSAPSLLNCSARNSRGSYER